ncbi:hypothetical protein CHUAL_014271 [Chamberlinius hualienensis]
MKKRIRGRFGRRCVLKVGHFWLSSTCFVQAKQKKKKFFFKFNKQKNNIWQPGKQSGITTRKIIFNDLDYNFCKPPSPKQINTHNSSTCGIFFFFCITMTF